MTTSKLEPEEDEVEFEVPVYLSKSLNGHLHVLQYPIRPASNTYDDDTILKVQMKPESHQLEMEIGVPSRVPTFDRSKGEQIALNVDGASRHNRDCDENFFKSSVMDKLVLNSSNVLSDPSRYAVAVMGGDSLHLTPISSVLALKPSFDYLDKADKRSKLDNKDNSDDSDGEPKERKLTVRFAGEETERSKKYREKSYNFLQKKIREEPWIPLEYHRYGSKSSEFENSKLFCAHTNDVVDQFHLDEATYLQQLVPLPDKKENMNGQPLHLLSNAEIRSLPLLDRLRAIMFNAKVVSFREILSTFNFTKKKSEETQTVLKTIQQVAVLVQGNWVAKSDVVFPKEVKEDEPLESKKVEANDEGIDIMQRTRDYVLYLLTQHLTVKREDICNALALPSSDVLPILKSIAKPVTQGVWELILPPDNAFITKYSEVEKRQNMIWQGRYEQLLPFLKVDSEGISFNVSVTPSSQRRNSTKDSQVTL